MLVDKLQYKHINFKRIIKVCVSVGFVNRCVVLRWNMNYLIKMRLPDPYDNSAILCPMNSSSFHILYDRVIVIFLAFDFRSSRSCLIR